MVSFASDYIAGARPEILKRLVETNMEALPGYGFDEHTEHAKVLIRKAFGAPDGMDLADESAGGNSVTAGADDRPEPHDACEDDRPEPHNACADDRLEPHDACEDDRYGACAAGADGVQVEFIAGGTQTNQIVISTMLRDWQGVLAADTGHVATHEAGAIEYSGHKVIGLPQEYGKIKADTVDDYIESFYADDNHEHEVFPGMVYISYPTEYGTLYSKEELRALHEVCRKHDIPLYIDGARLAYGLASSACDIKPEDLLSLCDVFYIGGTKCGALCGEVVVFTKGNRPEHFMNAVKKRGALLAKGRLIGVQFETLFSEMSDVRLEGAPGNATKSIETNALEVAPGNATKSIETNALEVAPGNATKSIETNALEVAPERETYSASDSSQGNRQLRFKGTLYYEVGRRGIEMAERLEKILKDKGCVFYLETPTNQKFVLMKDEDLERLKGKVDYGFWEKPDKDHTVIRFATSWSTSDEDLRVLKSVL